jgi:hypothetical protein
MKAAALLAGILLFAASGARAASPDARPTDTDAWHGRYCTPLGCGAGPAGSAADAAGFAAAAFGAAWLARRHPR